MFLSFQRKLHMLSEGGLSLEAGFTLIELLIVVAIIAILAGILIPNFLRARAQAQVAATKGNLKNVATALESYFVDNAMYPQAAGGQPAGMTTSYTRALPPDSCTGAAFGATAGLLYTPVGSPATDYVLQSTWVNNGAGSSCWNVSNGNWMYSPGGGLTTTQP